MAKIVCDNYKSDRKDQAGEEEAESCLGSWMDATHPADFIQAKEQQETAYHLLAKVKKKANLCIAEAV